jgi:hypothetical protein
MDDFTNFVPAPKSPEPVSVDDAVKGVVDGGETVVVNDVSPHVFNVTYDKYKQERRDGKVVFDYDQKSQTLKVVSP